MRRAAVTALMMAALIATVALAGCGSSTSPPVASGRTAASTAPATTSGRTGAGASPAATGSQTERPPTCYPVILTENSGNGPTYHVHICDALLKPQPGHEWQLIVDGGPLGNRAIIFGEQVPRQASH